MISIERLLFVDQKQETAMNPPAPCGRRAYYTRAADGVQRPLYRPYRTRLGRPVRSDSSL